MPTSFHPRRIFDFEDDVDTITLATTLGVENKAEAIVQASPVLVTLHGDETRSSCTSPELAGDIAVHLITVAFRRKPEPIQA